jgi:hypothetical protein
MMERHENQKSISSEDDVETLMAEDPTDTPQKSEENVNKFDLPPAVTKSKKNFVSKFFKKISASVSSAGNSHLAVLSVEGSAHEISSGNDLLDDATSLSKDTDSRPDDERMTSHDHDSPLWSHHTALQPSHLSIEEDSLSFDETSYQSQVV